MLAPRHTSDLMDNEDKFNVIWDTGASISITPNMNDFIEFNPKVDELYLEGVSKDLKVEGEGTVQWNIIHVIGKMRKIKIKALYVPTWKDEKDKD